MLFKFASYGAFAFLGAVAGVLLTAYSLYRERKKRNIATPFKYVVRDIFNEEVYKKK